MIFTPKPYQQEAIDFLCPREEAALFAGMGLGKTAMTLAALERNIVDLDSTAALVVAPLRVCNLTWPGEIEKWENFSYLRLANLRTKEGKEALRKRSAHIYCCNWEMLPRIAAEVTNPPWDTVVFDELTRAKGHGSERVNKFRPHAYKLARRWGLTGTPVPNSYLEIFAQIRLLDQGKRLGKSFFKFQHKFFHATDYMEYYWEENKGAIDEITALISDMTLTQRLSDYSDVADMESEEIEVTMPDDAWRVYKEMEDDFISMLERGEILAPSAGVQSMKLHQILGGAVYDEEKQVHVIHNAKIEALQKLHKKLGRPLLIACNFRHEQDRIAKALPGCRRFDEAGTPAQQRALVDDWNRGRISALVSDPRSIGHGLNLQEGGRDICWYSRCFSREIYDQFNARLHRTGQKDSVTLYHITVPGSLDDAIAESLRERDGRQRNFLAILKRLRASR